MATLTIHQRPDGGYVIALDGVEVPSVTRLALAMDEPFAPPKVLIEILLDNGVDLRGLPADVNVALVDPYGCPRSNPEEFH